MRSLSVRLLLSFLVLIPVPGVFAHDVTLNGTTSFASLDGSSSDHDGVANGVFTVDDGNLVINGTVNCNDGVGFPQSPCPMTFSVSGNLTVNAGAALSAEDRIANGTAASITLNVGGDLVLAGQSGSAPGALVTTAALVASNADGGHVTANVGGSITMGKGSTIDASSYKADAGNIALTAGGQISIDGNVLSGPSRTFTGSTTGTILSGAVPLQGGGQISIASSTFAEPALIVGTNAAIVSQGENPGAGPVTLDACGIEIRGLLASMGRNNTTTKVTVRSGKNILIDARDLGVSGATLGRVARLRADSTFLGSSLNRAVEVFARGSVSILGPAAGSSSRYSLSSNASGVSPNTKGGTIRVIALEGTLTATGRIADASQDFVAGQGGVVDLAAAGDIDLTAGHIRAIGNHTIPAPGRKGGTIAARSYAGNVVWVDGNGDVRPVGSSSGISPANQGTISLTACGSINTAGTSFPTNGVPTGTFPTTATGVCSPAAPSLPAGVVLVTCNTPPVANDTSATTNEDTTVTISLSGSDVDGDSLTFSVVSGPSNGTLGAIISTGPTTATVDYTPDQDFNGSDSFVYQANDGNGGTDNATATITVNAVNDPPSFLAGPTVSVLEDSGAQTYANWATSISAGPADESGQTVTFTVTNDNNALFSVQPSVDSTGTLTFTPAANAYGSATITITAQDDGGTANGGNDTSASQTSSITVNSVNDEPSFTAGASQTVNEDAGPQTVANWATAISAGPNEGSQTVSFVVSNDNNALFSAQPSVDTAGTLTYTLAADANGVATVSIYAQDDGGTANGGDDTSPTQTFTITVNAVNDAPSFTSGGDVAVLEDSGPYSAAWATAISAGPADESGQTVAFTVSNDNGALFSAQPSIDPSGTLSFIVAPNAFGSATVTVTLSDNGGTANGGVDTSAPQTFTLTVTAVNDEPSFIAGGDVTVNEDSGLYSATWATGISAGFGETQTLTFVVSNDDNSLFAAQPAISASGVLTFTPAADAHGLATVTVYLLDDGGTANGGDDTSDSVTFTITVNSVNDAPSFTSGGDVTVNEDSGAYSAAWATAISAGPANESGQTLTFSITGNSNPALFASGPALSSTGVLSFTLAANAFGSSTITVTLSDDGGTANGGVDTSAPQSFTITVNAVNDAPSFTPGGNVTVNEDSGAYSAVWATSISAGPNEGGQTVAFHTSNDNNALFSAQPSIDAAGVLTFTPAPNAYGTATVSVYAQDNGGTANGGVDTSATVTFVITVNAVNDPPVAGNDVWETEGNTELRVDNIPSILPYVGDTTSSGRGVLDNDADPVEGDPVIVTGIVGCADTTAPFDCAVTGGTVSLADTGYFSFKPAPGATSASFQYVVTDQPSAGTPASAIGTVTIIIHDMIWYVNGSASAGGNGTSSSPFSDFTSLNGLGDVDGPGDYIFVHSSNVNGSIALEASQKLWGQGIGLVIPRNLNGNGFPTTLAGAFSRPNVSSTGDTVTVTGVTGVEIAGLNLTSSAGNAIDVTSPPFGAAASASIYSNEVLGAALEGIDVNGFSASGTSVSIDSTSVTSTGNGVDVLGADGDVVFSYGNGTITSVGGSGLVVNGATADSLVINGLSNVTISGNTAGNGISITAARFDANAGTAAFDTLNAGAMNVGASGNPVGGSAVVMNNVSGDLAFGSLHAYGSTSGVTIAGTGLFTGGTGMQITSGGGAISAPAGAGLSVTNSAIGAANLSFTSISSTNGVNGIRLNNTGMIGGLIVTGTGAANSGGVISGATGDGVSLTGTANVALSSMSIHQSRGNGIYGDAVTGFALANSTVTESDFDNIGFNEAGIRFGDLSGNASISDSTVSGTNGDSIRMSPTTAVLNDLAITNSIIGPNTLAGGGNGVALVGAGTSSTKITVTGTAFTGNQGSGFLTTITDDASADITVTGSTFTGNHIGVDFGTSLNGDQTFVVTNNTFLNHELNAVNIISGTDTTNASRFVGTIANNQIGNGTADSGSESAFGIAIDVRGDVDSIFAVQSNSIRNTDMEGIFVQSRLDNDADAETGRIDLTLTGNTIGVPDDNSAFPFGFVYGVRIESRNTTAMYLNIAGNTAGSVGGAEHFRVRQRDLSTFNLERFTGMGTSAAAVAGFVAGENAGGSTASATVATTFTGVPSGTTRTP